MVRFSKRRIDIVFNQEHQTILVDNKSFSMIGIDIYLKDATGHVHTDKDLLNGNYYLFNLAVRGNNDVSITTHHYRSKRSYSLGCGENFYLAVKVKFRDKSELLIICARKDNDKELVILESESGKKHERKAMKQLFELYTWRLIEDDL